MKQKLVIFSLVIFINLFTSCITNKTPVSEQVGRTPVGETKTPTSSPIPTQTLTPESTPLNSNYPTAAILVREALAEELDISTEKIMIISTEEKNWPDSCLGLAEPSEMCLQVITPGYIVILQVDQTSYEYHTNANGAVYRRVSKP